MVKSINKFRLLVFPLIFAAGLTAGWFINDHPIRIHQATYQKNSPQAFYSEAYDKIKENYWEKITDEQLIEMFKTASTALNKPINAKIESKNALLKELNKADSVKLVSQVLVNLKPQGRSGIFTTKQEEQLKNTVSNVNPDKDLYKDLGLAKGASKAAVEEA